MWDDYFKRWVDLLFWWLPRKDEPPSREADQPAPGAAEPRDAREPPGAAEPGPAPEPATVARPAPEAPARAAPDDLTVIKGIGPAVQDKLRSLGITTFKDLAAADPDDLTEQLKGSHPISRARVTEWTATARERAGPHA